MKHVSILALLVLPQAILGASCATTTTEAVGMTPDIVAVEHHHPYMVEVVARGKAEGFMGAGEITDEALRTAIVATIEETLIFSKVAQPGEDAPCRLEVEVLELKGTEYTVDMSASVKVRWTLLDLRTNTVVWKRDIESQGKANSYNAEGFEDRYRMALELAAKDNIERGLKAVSRVGSRK